MEDYTAAVVPAADRGDRAPWGLADMAKAVALVILLTVLASIPAAIVAAAIAGGADVNDNPNSLAIVLGISVVLEGLMLWTAFRFSVQKYGLQPSALGLRRPKRAGWWMPFALLFGSLALMYVYFAVLNVFGVSPNTDLPEGVFDDARPLAVLFVLSVFVAPPVEEIFFRGFIFGGLRPRWGATIAALASGALFGLAHIGNPGTVYLLPPIAAVGALFAFGYVYTGSILPTMGAHFLFNLLQVALGIATS